jgi:hypothetical protein
MTPDRAGRLWTLWLPIGLAVVLALLGTLAPGFYEAWMNDEQGVVELGQWLALLAAIVLAARLLVRSEVRRRPALLGWVALAGLACFYVAGEEVSWGQHLLQWNTPEYWRAVNDQQETNLHNTSSWFDQKPRTLLELGVILGGLLAPLLRKLRPGLFRGLVDLLAPTAATAPIAMIAELAGFSERLGFNIFFRPSEVQELYFYAFALVYLVELGRRLSGGKTATWS